ncbi:MAG: mismatch repair protein MutT [Bacteroidota bacterium]|nr:mismatch repair protein MutT [Bacteroidota bacterium]
MNKDPLNTWKTLSSELIYESPWIAINKHQTINPAGNPAIYSVVNFKNKAIGVLPLSDDGFTWLVGQWRYPLNAYSWEIPEGGGPLDEEPLDTAVRELKEETGIIAAHFEEIMQMHLSNSVSDEHAYIFVATGLSFGEAEPEESEDLKIKKIHFKDVFNMVLDGKITDSISVAAIFKVKYLIDQGKIKLTNL